MELIGDVKGKNVVLVDDMVDTAGTLTKAAELMLGKRAKSVRAVCLIWISRVVHMKELRTLPRRTHCNR